MKRVVIVMILAGLVLAACSQPVTPTASDSEMATKVAQVLTNMPTATGQGPKVTTTTPGIPTLAMTATKSAQTTPAGSATTAPPEPTQAPTQAATETVALPTATQPAPTQTPSAATATSVAGDPRSGLGNPTWTDNMDNGSNWPTGTDPAGYTEIDFQNGFMELTALQPIDGWRLTFKHFSNAYLEMTVDSGACLPKDRYGVIVRVPNSALADRGCMFSFTCDGKFAIRKWDGPANAMTNLINWKANAAIKSGANQTNRLGVKTDGSQLSIYANGVLLGQVEDSSWSEGVFGIFAGAHESDTYTIKVDQISFWDLP